MATNILTIMPDTLRASTFIIDDALMKAKGWYHGWHESFEREDWYVDVFEDDSKAEKYLSEVRAGNIERRKS